MGLRTPLFENHVSLGAKIVDFGGWDMPLHYGSQIEEHHAVRRDAGMFDVSHMGIIDLRGPRTGEFLRYLLANDVAKLQAPGKGLYSCLLREDGGVLDDLIAYRMSDTMFRIVVNAGTRAKDLAWIHAHALPYGVEVRERRDLAMIAVQGPQARAKAARLLASAAGDAVLALAPFASTELVAPQTGAAESGAWFVARTGYTGEDGFEIAIPAARASQVWEALRAQGVAAAGLGARDTLRLEAGMSLYGNDLDEAHDPFASALGWTVALDPQSRQFIGRGALQAARGAQAEELVGLLLEARGVLRSHQRVVTARGPGEITSGSFSPTLSRSIALARVPAGSGGRVQVDVRGKLLAATVVKPPFVRHGKVMIPIETTGDAP